MRDLHCRLPSTARMPIAPRARAGQILIGCPNCNAVVAHDRKLAAARCRYCGNKWEWAALWPVKGRVIRAGGKR